MRLGVERSLIRFPLDGQDLALLVEAHGGTARCSLSRAARFRRQAKMRELGLWRDDGGALPHPIVAAAAAAFEERRDLPETLQAPDLPVLASLPDRRPWFPAHRISGLERHTWGRAAMRLHRAQLVLKPSGGMTLDPGLPALVDLVASYRDLYRVPPDGHRRLTWRAFHQSGAETMWRLPTREDADGLVRIGPGSGHPVVAGLVPAYGIAYLGPRRPDAWDHLMAPLAAGLPMNRALAESDSIDSWRLIGLLTAAARPRALASPRVRARAAHYRIESVLDLAIEAHEQHSGPAWTTARRLVAEGHVEEAVIDA